MADSFPRRFGPYVLIRILGVGGMGDVYLALTGKAGMEKPCVVKRLAEHSTSEDGVRFRREANLARKLSHGAIVQTLAVDEIDGELVIAQEFLHGCSVSSLLAACLRQRERLPRELAVHIAREVARALAYAHEQDVIHRDIAPDNVMLTFNGEVRLLDFGIARIVSDPRLTRPGWSVGREAYAAPEVAAGGGGDPRSDIYSLGILLWQLLAGRPPPIKEGLRPPSQFNQKVSPDLDSVVLRAVARDPIDRFQRADEVLKALGSQLPAEFSGEAEVAGFLQKHYDVVRERDLIDKDLARGRAFLDSSSTQERAELASSTSVRPKQSRGARAPLLIAASTGVALLGAVALVAIRARSPESMGARPVSASAPQPQLVAPSIAPGDGQPRVPTLSAQASERALAQPPANASPPRRRVRSAGAERAPGVGPSSPGPSSTAQLLAEGQQRFDTGDIDGALRSARSALRAGGGAPAHLLAGRALAKKNQLRDAERELATAARLDPTNVLAAQRLREIRERLQATAASPE
jgi:serine/threonine protein kinase